MNQMLMDADSLEPLLGLAPPEENRRPGVLLPYAARLGGRGRLLVYLSLLALAAAACVDLLHVMLGLAPSWEGALHGPVVAGANVLAAVLLVTRAAMGRRDRLVWWLVAAGFSFYAIGGVLWNCWLQYLPHPPTPSIADGFWLGMYPFIGAALVCSARRSSRREDLPRIVVDGFLSATAAAAICAVFIAPPLLRAAQRDHGALVTDLMYPVADMVIGALGFAVLSIGGWRVNRRWAMVIGAFVLWLLGDSLWAVQIGSLALTGNSGATLCYLVGCVLVAAAGWQPEAPAGADAGPQPRTVAPIALALVPLALLVYDHFSRISLIALVLTWLALLGAIARIATAMRDALVLRDVQRAAMTDELTELPNRRMFLARLREQVDSMQRRGGTLTTLMLDLDNFKQLNDTLGHHAGDELLRLTGPRLAGAVRSDDLVARLGGDEFAILLPNCSHEAAAAVAQTVLDSFNEPLEVYGLALRLTASLGIASFPQDATSADTLLRCADVAMYEAKRSRSGWAHYSPERDVNTRERLKMSGELARALQCGEIEVAFQAIADTDTRRIRTAEALVRWRQPDGTLRPPSEFLEAAELSGLSRQLTRRVLKLALDNVSAWRANGHMIAVSVNTAVADLLDESFPDEVAEALESRGLESDVLKIEVTESSIMANPTRVSSVLERLRNLGVKIALDDFGTGYSSLTHLRQLPVDRLKIDRSFVTNMRTEPTDAAIVYATIELAHRLNLLVIAEGVEDEETWQTLIELDCDAIQGYALGRPVEPDVFAAQLDATRQDYLADSQSLPTPASTASGGSIS